MNLDRRPRRSFATLSLALAVVAVLPATRSPAVTDAAKPAPSTQPFPAIATLDDVVGYHPAGDALRKLFPAQPAAVPADFAPTGLDRTAYVRLVAGSVDYFRTLQDERGAIIDPFEKAEKQYATPCFAHAAAFLVDRAGRADLIEPAGRALGFAINALATKTTADKHPDFYIPSVVHALRHLKPHVPAERYEGWTATLKKLVPEKTYVDTQGGGNWNTVNVCGESMRANDGLVADELKAAHAKYLEKCLAKQQTHALTKFGLYYDGAIVPMAYDAFPRMWWEEMLADGYAGPARANLENFLTIGGFSTLLLQSPNGEWAPGGRSSHHQWNEAEIAVICELNANRWKARGRDDVASAFKRAARLAVQSIQRWQRPSGELFITKNRAEPERRHGYEGYSFKTNYGLLPIAMLAIAHERADDSIAERPTPSEVGGYVFDARDIFYKVSAAAGGYYVLVDTASDAHYNATGLQRVTRVGVPLSPLSDSTAAHRWYHPKEDPTKIAMTPALAWKAGENWTAVSDFVRFKPGLDRNGKVLPNPQQFVAGVALDVAPDGSTGRVSFTVRYDLKGRGAAPVAETYTLSADGVTGTTRVEPTDAPERRFEFPALVSDGAADTRVDLAGGRLRIDMTGGRLELELTSPTGATFALDGPRVPSHNGYVQAAVAPLPAGTSDVTWRIQLSPESK